MPVRFDIEPGRSALLIVDMTNDFLLPGALQECPAGRDIIGPLALLADDCRAAGMPVIYTTHVHKPDGSDIGVMKSTFTHLIGADGRPRALIDGTPGVQVHEKLAPRPGETVIKKSRYSAFYETVLEEVLRRLSVTTLIVGGVATNVCCESTARDAMFRDYEVIFLSDGNANRDLGDVGWGAMSGDEIRRAVLTTLATAFCEVAPVAQVRQRVQQAGKRAHHAQLTS